MFKTSPVEWCALMNGTKINTMTKAFFDVYAKSIKPLMKKCPITGRVNLKIEYEKKNNFVTMLPSGNYQFGQKIYNSDDAEIFMISFIVKIY